MLKVDEIANTQRHRSRTITFVRHKASAFLAALVAVALIAAVASNGSAAPQAAEEAAKPAESVQRPAEPAAQAAEAAPAPAEEAAKPAEPAPKLAETPAEPTAAAKTDVQLDMSQILDRLAAAAKAPEAASQTAPAAVQVPQAVSMMPTRIMPPDSTKLITLPKLSKVEITEIADQIAMQLNAQLNYVAADILGDALPVPPNGIIGDRILARTVESNAYILRFGYRHFVTQPPQMCLLGVVADKDGNLSANPDLALMESQINKAIESLNQMRASLEVRDLEAKLIQLSYVDAATALDMLHGLGITTMAKAADVPPKIDFARLPFVVKIEDPQPKFTGLIGAQTKTAGSKLSLSPGVASDMSENALAAPLTQLMVMFHPAHPEQFSRVRRALDEYVDRPARQIFIEGMVLEISEDGLRDIGVNWKLHDWKTEDGHSVVDLSGGKSMAGDTNDTLNLTLLDTSLLHRVFTGEFQWDWRVTIRALVRSGKAQILSRPSVLTLDNRQSTIRVGEDIPIASSLEGFNYSNKIGFSFEYLPTGILLNIRPRINESGKEVTMLIDTIVSAPVPDSDLEMRAPDGTVLASAPTVSTRRVQTYGRIANNTPLIIGGLVSSDDVITRDKVPILGDIPLLGMAFRGERKRTEKREVIIVLTPHVLPEQDIRRSYPKDEDAFDNFGHDLFRDSYRIRGEDVFDLTFLLENQRIALYRNLAREAAQKNFRLGEEEPFRSFVQDSIPGESILVTRMIYEVVKRLDIAAPVDESRVIYFASHQVGGYDVKWLRDLILDEEARLRDFDGKALAITYHRDRTSLEQGRMGSEPIPLVEMVDCPDKKAWGVKLWELNQPLPDGRQRHTILITDESDVVRLRRALTLKRIVELNGGIDQMRLKNFSVGKTLLMPELKKDQVHVIDSDTAMFFFHTELYYAAALQEIEKQLKELDSMLRQPEIKMLLDSELPNGDTSEPLQAAAR
ncbi:MAG TPA: hypothetical protein P5279_12235 [Anaerohalosphaeraceae bacterium]|jgi:general secretion pathway protein D|nr:hypothetical protein [Anaerohalosphaeraceae bacterium]HRT51258.1 hypothetical protein [Anaerohalosphaeraceae bacterium]HRT87775.1 hypothetical protein [Anaerohalosphaeraceae bacterium]